LANPRIRAKSREKAHILIGDKYPVVTATAAPTAGFISQNVTYIDVGIKVEIEPVVGLDGDVTIKLNLEVSSIANQITTSSGTVAYQIGTRSAGTTLRLQDGETQVLGGLISKNNSTSANRIPGLGDLPIAGRLFSSQNDSSQRDEVVLSITPHIISNLQRPEAASGAFFSGTDASTHLAIADTAQEAPRPPSAQGVPVAPISNPDALPTPPTTSQLPASPAIGPVLPPANAIPSSAPPLPPSVASGLAVLVNAPVAVRAGDMLTVSITANIATALRAVPIEITYDPAKLRFEGFEAGQLLGDPHEASVSHSVYPAEGRVTLAIASNRPQGLSGSGVLGTLRFTAMQLGSAKLQMTAVTPMGALGPVPAPTLAAPAIVQVQ
jgi:general secretion pathway protein D